MLVLSRRSGERLLIGDNIELTVMRVTGMRVVLALNAPGDIRIVRGELAKSVGSLEEGASEDDPVLPRPSAKRDSA